MCAGVCQTMTDDVCLLAVRWESTRCSHLVQLAIHHYVNSFEVISSKLLILFACYMCTLGLELGLG